MNNDNGNDKPISRLFRPGVVDPRLAEHEILIDADTAIDPATIPTLLEGAIRLKQETGFGRVRDVESEIFSRPAILAPQADFDGDTPHGNFYPSRVPARMLMRRYFNNLSLTEKNKIRKIRKQLSKVTFNTASALSRNMKKLHDK